VRDYSLILKNMQQNLARKYQEDSDILNIPGTSVACKVDHLYYLALRPTLEEQWAKWSGTLPRVVLEALMRSGNLISSSQDRELLISLNVQWPAIKPKSVRVQACFVLADFIDGALKIYARQEGPLPVSDLKIMPEEKEVVQSFFQGKTALSSLAFG
jgi:hypothetical protein